MPHLLIKLNCHEGTERFIFEKHGTKKRFLGSVECVEFPFTRIYLARCVSRALISTTAGWLNGSGEKRALKEEEFRNKDKKGGKCQMEWE